MDPHFQTLQTAIHHHKRNELDRAEALYREVLAAAPGHPEALGMLGQLLVQSSRPAEGVAALQQAIAAKPREPAFHAALGQAMVDLGRLDEAIVAQRAAADLVPQMAALHYNLAISLKARGRLVEAETAFRKAVTLQRTLAPAHINLGNVLLDQGRVDDAIASYREGLRLAPNDALARNNLGNACKAGGHMEDAETAFREALRLNPQFAEAWSNLADVCLLTGRHDEALQAQDKARQLAPKNPVIHSNYITMLLFHPAMGQDTQRRELDAWRGKFADPLKVQITPHTNDRTPDRPLRIGFVSPDLRDHVVGRNVLPLFKHHDRSQFSFICYSGALRQDALSARFGDLAAKITLTAGMTDDQLATAIRADEIDILVDFALHMAGSRLLTFARKPAPIQVTFAGYPGTTGLDTVDYRLTDAYLDSENAGAAFVEKPIYLPSFWCYDPIEAALPVGDLPALSSPGVTFACLNNFSKTNEATLALWARVISATPESRLMLLADEGPHRARVIGFMLRRGVAPEQIRFIPKLPRAAYLELHQQADIGLDTFPYCGHTTTLDALFMGVPVVTLPGDTAVGRGGLSQLTNVGMPELIAKSPDDFVRIATELARDLPRLRAIRGELRPRMERSVLMDGNAFAQNIQSAFRDMWRTWCST